MNPTLTTKLKLIIHGAERAQIEILNAFLSQVQSIW